MCLLPPSSHRYVELQLFLESLNVKDAVEKDRFFSKLAERVPALPKPAAPPMVPEPAPTMARRRHQAQLTLTDQQQNEVWEALSPTMDVGDVNTAWIDMGLLTTLPSCQGGGVGRNAVLLAVQSWNGHARRDPSRSDQWQFTLSDEAGRAEAERERRRADSRRTGGKGRGKGKPTGFGDGIQRVHARRITNLLISSGMAWQVFCTVTGP